jgi:hypothetical protein
MANDTPFGEWYDNEGNIRVIRVVWRSWKKIGKLTYFDEDGMPQETIVPERFDISLFPNAEVKWLWVSEWMEGTRIGKEMYIKIQPRPVQFRSMNNLSKSGSGYVGIAYNTNTSRAKSLMDRMKPYQYLYNVFMYRTELAFAKSKGRIASLDLAQVPDHWDIDKWMYYAEVHGWAVKDSFKEAKKGAAQGKLAGQMQAQSPVLDMEMGNYIQQNIQMLQFIEVQVGKIAGVTDQRQGQIENRELVGNVERSVTQSSHITERWFSLHAGVKRKALEILLETTKFAWRSEGDKRVQYVLDDMSSTTLQLDGQQFNESDYGVVISDASADTELNSTLKQLAQAGLQNDKINFSQIMDIYLDPSTASMRRKIEQFEAQKQQEVMQQQQQAQQMQQQQLQAQAQQAQAQREFEMAKLDKEYQYKMQIEQMKAQAKLMEGSTDGDQDNDGIPDMIEMEKMLSSERMKMAEIDSKEKLEKEKMEHDSKEGDKDRKNKLELERLKAKNKPTLTKK